MTDDVEEIDIPAPDSNRKNAWKPYGQVWDDCPKSKRKKIKPEEKKHIRCLFIYKPKFTKNKYELGMLTDNYEFYHCQIYTKYVDITTDLWLKMRRAYLPFKFSKTTDVMFTNNISVYEPIMFYHKILQEQIFFNMRAVDELNIPKRIEAFHPRYIKHVKDKGITMGDVPKLWKKLVEKKMCPWINEEIDNWIKDEGSVYRMRVQFIRLALYYMLVKQHLYIKYKNSYGYRKKHGRLTSEEIAAEKMSSSGTVFIQKEETNNETE